MKYLVIIITILSLIATTSFSQNLGKQTGTKIELQKPKDTKLELSKSTCGKTTEECQIVVDNLTRQISIYRNLLSEANDRIVGTAAK